MSYLLYKKISLRIKELTFFGPPVIHLFNCIKSWKWSPALHYAARGFTTLHSTMLWCALLHYTAHYSLTLSQVRIWRLTNNHCSKNRLILQMPSKSQYRRRYIVTSPMCPWVPRIFMYKYNHHENKRASACVNIILSLQKELFIQILCQQNHLIVKIQWGASAIARSMKPPAFNRELLRLPACKISSL